MRGLTLLMLPTWLPWNCMEKSRIHKCSINNSQLFKYNVKAYAASGSVYHLRLFSPQICVRLEKGTKSCAIDNNPDILGK